MSIANKMLLTNLVILILTVLINGDMCSPVVKAGYDYEPVADSWLRLHEIPATWQGAVLQCHLEDGKLASPTSVELASAMKAMLAARGLALGSAYTGLHDTIAKGHYTTLDGYKRDQTTGSCYKFHVAARPWHLAAAACAAERAHLAVVNSDEESKALQQLIKSHRKPNDRQDIVHIGFHYWKAADDFFTIFGKTLDEAGFSKWNQNEPNNYAGSEFCGSLADNGLLNDISCTEKRAFICEITP